MKLIRYVNIIYIFFFLLLIAYSFYFFETNIYWNYYQFHWDITLGSFAIVLACFLLNLIVSKFRSNDSLLNLLSIIVIFYFFLAFFSAVNKIALINIVFIFISFGFALFFRLLNSIDKSIINNYLLGIIIFQFFLLSLSFFNLIIFEIVIPIFLIMSASGFILSYNFLKKKIYKLDQIKITKIESISIIILAVILFYSFILTCLPQTQSDGLVYRLTFLNELKDLGAIPFHYYQWDWVTSQSMKLALVPGFFINNEYGASIQIYIFYIIFSLILFRIFISFKLEKDTSLIFLIILISAPFIWIESFSIFFEIPSLCFVFAAIFSLIIKDKTNNNYYIYLSSLFAAFAITIKINNLAFIFTFFFAYLLVSRMILKKSFISLKELIICLLISLIICAPWFLWTYNITGNPIYPFLNNLFPNSIPGIVTLLPEYKELFYYTPSIQNIILFPYNLFNNGFIFHSLDGSTNIWPIYLFFLLPIFLLYCYIKNFKKFILLYSLILTSILTIILTYIFGSSTLILRYWIIAYSSLIVSSLILFAATTNLLKDHNIINSSFKLALVFWSLFYLSFAGVRLNYEINLGHDLFWSQEKLQKKIEQLTYGLDKFINKNLEEDQYIAVTGQYYPIHKFKNHTFNISQTDGLFGNISTVEKTIEFIKEENIRFWIVDLKEENSYLKKFYKQNYLKDQKLIYGNEHFIIYDLINDVDEPLKSDLNILENNNFLTKIIPKDTKWANFIVDLNSFNSENTLIIKKIIYDEKKNILYENYENRLLKKGSNQLYLPTIIPSKSYDIYIEFYEWKPSKIKNIELTKISTKFY